MNKIDVFLNKVGRQTLLTTRLLRDGSLNGEDSIELSGLREVDIIIDNKQMGVFNSIFGGYNRPYSSGVSSGKTEGSGRVNELISIVEGIEKDYYIPSVYSDLCRLKALNNVILKFVDIVPEPIVNALMYSLYVASTRFSMYPTQPIALKAASLVVISPGKKESNILNEIAGNCLLLGRMESIITKISELSPSELIEYAAEIFEPHSIQKIAKDCSEDRLFDKDDPETVIDIIAAFRDFNGYIDYRLLLIEMLFNKVNQVLEERSHV